MEIRITPVELYFLGTILHAKQIDYTYIAAMENIQNNFELHSQEAITHLVSLGIVDEDFSGELHVSEEVKEIVNPLFFSEKESSVDVCSISEHSRVDVYKFHFLDERVTLVTGENEFLIIKSVDDLFLIDFVNALISENSESNESYSSKNFDYDSITRLIAVKNTVGPIVRVYYEANDTVFVENEIDIISSVSKESFIQEVISLLKGYRYDL